MTVHPPITDSRGAGSLTTGQFVARISEDVHELVRDELRLARLETTEKAKGLGIGAGMLGAAGLLALYGVREDVAAIRHPR